MCYFNFSFIAYMVTFGHIYRLTLPAGELKAYINVKKEAEILNLVSGKSS